jgi:hypothetical protein
MILRPWHNHLLNPSAEDNVNTLTETVGWLFDDLMEDIQIDLSGLKADEINPQHLATILRGTYSRQDTIPGWQEALNVAKEAFSKEDALDALDGLDTPYVKMNEYPEPNWMAKLFNL